MKLENQVCSLELAKKFKELGIKQESLFRWVTWLAVKHVGLTDEFRDSLYPSSCFENLTTPAVCKNYYSAFTVAELGEMLPQEVLTYKYAEDEYSSFMCKLHVEGDCSQYIELTEAVTEADARAKMLIYLIENKLITLPQ